MATLSLQSLTLSHFRSHRRVQLDLDPRPIAIFGANGAGKTNLIEAVSLLSPGRGMRRAGPDDLTRRPEAIGWKISALLKTPSDLHELETTAEAGQSRVTRIDGKSSPQIGLGKIARVLWLVPSMDRLWIEGAEGRRRFLDRATLSLTPSHAEAVLRYDKAMRERNRLLKDMVRDAHWYIAIEQHMAEAAADITAGRLNAIAALQAGQDLGDDLFPKSDLALANAGLEDAGTDTEGWRTIFSEGRQQDLAAARTLSGPHRADLDAVFAAKGVSAKDCSTGEQKALLISLILANARKVGEDFGAPPIILLDEVAAHLDADRRAALYDEICALGAQAWMTGTEQGLFDTLGDRGQYIEVSETSGESKIERRD